MRDRVLYAGEMVLSPEDIEDLIDGGTVLCTRVGEHRNHEFRILMGGDWR